MNARICCPWVPLYNILLTTPNAAARNGAFCLLAYLLLPILMPRCARIITNLGDLVRACRGSARRDLLLAEQPRLAFEWQSVADFKEENLGHRACLRISKALLAPPQSLWKEEAKLLIFTSSLPGSSGSCNGVHCSVAVREHQQSIRRTSQ